MKHYRAPDGYLFDYKDPHYVTIIDTDGSIIHDEEHLYAKELSLGMFDSIDLYRLVEDPHTKPVK